MGLLQVGFETEGTAIFDTMQYVTNEVRRLVWRTWHSALQRVARSAGSA